MRRGKPSPDYASPYASPDNSVLSGLTVKVSRETRHARSASGVSRMNVSPTYRPRAEDLAGMDPATSRVKTRDERGTRIPDQHMITTRKRHERDGQSASAPFTRYESQDERCRMAERDRVNSRDLDEIR